MLVTLIFCLVICIIVHFPPYYKSSLKVVNGILFPIRDILESICTDVKIQRNVFLDHSDIFCNQLLAAKALNKLILQ